MLLPIIVLLPFAVIAISIARGLSHAETAAAIAVSEAVLQTGYFFGLLVRLIASLAMQSFTAAGFSRGRRDGTTRRNDRHTAPPAGASGP
ncbi:MAG TPA: hypothetical protein VFL62_11085 [Bradyrhizobium sp.]|uniref:hypothetical protein n=1 Tax=Bradyrhizobium sp. TaxID=376 RepID=UPI002D7EBD4B|nr:hypothetical protein [Bradyrhizobium sp.]HET7886761.1 hypothetical protein [Bradyrhizobium sp.]